MTIAATTAGLGEHAWLAFSGAALGVLVVAAVCGARWRAACAWLLLLLASQAALLALVVAGPRVAYHHLRFEHSSAHTIACGSVLAVQLAGVAVGLLRHAGELRRAVARLLPGWRAAAFAVLTLALAAKISRPGDRSAVEFALLGALQLVALANLALAVRALSVEQLARAERGLDRWLGPRGGAAPEPGGVDRFALLTAASAVALAALLNVWAYECVPHVPDEIVYRLHARYLAQGQLWLDPPPVPAAFDLDLMLLDGGKWYCPVPPGWPLVLALGELAGAPWLVNPVLGGAAVLVAYALLRELTDRRNARLGVLLLAASPWFTFLNMSFMTHSWTLVCALVAALGVARARRGRRVAWCATAGVALGVVALVRPLDGVLVALALGLWALGLGGARLRLAPLATLVVVAAAVGASTLAYNAALTGSATNFPIQHYVDVVYGPGKNAMGFGPEKGLGWGGLDPWPGHSLGEALVTAQFNAFALGSELFGWGAGSLMFVWIWLVAARWSRTDRAMAAFAALIVVSSLFYWFNGGPDFGARYWALALVPCIALTLSGLRHVEANSEHPARALVFVAGAVFVAAATWVPWRAVDKYHGYRGVHPLELGQLASAPSSLVIVAGDRHPDFAAAALHNDFGWSATAPVIAWGRDAVTFEQLLQRFAGREVRFLERGRLSAAMSADEARRHAASAGLGSRP